MKKFYLSIALQITTIFMALTIFLARVHHCFADIPSPSHLQAISEQQTKNNKIISALSTSSQDKNSKNKVISKVTATKAVPSKTTSKTAQHSSSPKTGDFARCLRAIDFYEQKYNIPRNLLYALTIVESGKWQEEHGVSLPYPWVLNVEGEPHFFENKQQAAVFLRKAINQGKKSIDVGCGQVNIHYHGHHFEKPENLLNPVYNIAYAAYFVARNFAESGSWSTAISQYHSRTPELGRIYWQRIQDTMKKIHKHRDQYDALRATHSVKLNRINVNRAKLLNKKSRTNQNITVQNVANKVIDARGNKSNSTRISGGKAIPVVGVDARKASRIKQSNVGMNGEGIVGSNSNVLPNDNLLKNVNLPIIHVDGDIAVSGSADGRRVVDLPTNQDIEMFAEGG